MVQVTKLVIDGRCPFDDRYNQIKDPKAKAKITARLTRLALGNAGDHKALSQSLYELRIDTGKGWRVYYTQKDGAIIILLLVGDKTQQRKDIATVKEWMKSL